MLVVDGTICLRERKVPYRILQLPCGLHRSGESAEDTVRREVKEEVDLNVGAIRYYKSQSWPFPSQLMLGFIDASGEIRPEPGEIEEAHWYDIRDLPAVPSAKVGVSPAS